MKQQIRVAARIGDQAVVQCISEIRQRRSVGEFRSCVSALKTYAPKQAQQFFLGGPFEFKGLVWARPAFSQMSFERELIWAVAWLSGQSKKVNAFRSFSLRLQDQFLRGEVKAAARQLDAFMALSRWSLWGVELRCALGPLAYGLEAQRKWVAELQQSAPNSIPGLLLHIYSERNDETLSYDAFYSKCMESFYRYKSVADWLPRYLLYRGLSSYDDPSATFCAALARDATSSLFDYYETLVEAIKAISNEKSLRELRKTALLVIEALERDGFVDHRLGKLSIALSGEVTDRVANVDVGDLARDISSFVCARINEPKLEYKDPVLPLIGLLRECRDRGVAAGNAAAAILKFGLNYRGLDSAAAIGMASQDTASDLISTRSCSLDCVLVSPTLQPEDIASFPDHSGRLVLKWLSMNHDSEDVREKCSTIFGIIDGEPVHSSLGLPGVLDLWLGRQLVIMGRYDEAAWLGQQLENRGDHWARHGAKLRMWALIREDKLVEALEFAAGWLVQSPEYVVELPFKELFEGRDWSQFRSIDPVLVAIVSHNVHVAFGSNAVGYICKMACRQFAVRGQRDCVTEMYAVANEDEKARLLIFLREVWVEENLSMNHLLESTDDVRAERMNILQLLLAWDPSNEQIYIDAIKSLTFDETLRQGLRHINQTRVFVNEMGITRWVEKDLYQDYERWVSLAGTSGDTEVVTGLVRQYIVDPQNESFLEALGGGKPTEADALLTSLIDRLFKRFLTDPVDGLDCYLSLRIRHGSLRGTLFGPLEEQGLFYSASGFSKAAFEKRWMSVMDLDDDQASQVFGLMEAFTIRLRAIADELVNERVQIRSVEKPRGAVAQLVHPAFAAIFSSALATQQILLTSFAYTCYFVFWKFVELGLEDLARYVRDDVKVSIQTEFDALVASLRRMSTRTLPLITALTTVATTTQSQCDTIADWFRLPGKSKDEKYKLSAAIEIARAATKNVHRAFPAEVQVGQMPEGDPPLTTLALAVLSDGLFVIFENAWKHSGLGPETGGMNLDAAFDPVSKLLTLTVRSDISDDVRARLEEGLVKELREKYLAKTPIELASREGGSGFAKLARLSRHVDRSICNEPLRFGIEDRRWVTSVTILLFERDGAYEAFQ